MQVTFTGLWCMDIKSEHHLCLNISITISVFQKMCKRTVVNSFNSAWDAERRNTIFRFQNQMRRIWWVRKLFNQIRIWPIHDSTGKIAIKLGAFQD